MDDCYDVLGVGFGPANLSLAIALEEDGSPLTARFFEAQREPVWQGGMLLDGVNTQNHPCRDLVTLRNPRSRYSFLNYLFENGRLIEHLNLPVEFPLRKEYAQYVRWVTGQFGHVVELGTRIVDLAIEQWHGEPVYVATDSRGRRALGRSLVVGTGRTPYVPAPFDQLATPRVFHLTDYLYRIRELTAPPRRVAVIGGSQSAVEVTLDLARRFPDAEIVNYVRSYSLRAKDNSPFSEEGYFPGFTEYYFKASRSGKRMLDAYMRPTNYSASDEDVLHELYLLIYEQGLDGRVRVRVAGNREISSAVPGESGVRLEVFEAHTGVVEHDEADFVVLATGFCDLGPGLREERCPRLLNPVIDRFRFDEDGYLSVNADYSLQEADERVPPLFLNGLCESTHGIGDAGSFSLLSLRALAIRDGLHSKVPPVSAPAGPGERVW